MSLELRYEIEGDEQLARRLHRIGDGVKDFSPEFKEGTNYLKDFFGGEVFDTRGRAIGEPWKPTKNPWPILEKTGKMRRSFRARAQRTEGVVYNAVDYFKYHQSKEPRHKLPRRIMMKLTNQLKDKIVSIFHNGLWKRIEKSKHV